MSWEKLGIVYSPDPDYDWIQSHAQLPVAYQIKESRYRIFIAGRNEDNMSQTGFVDIDLTTLDVVAGPTAQPLLKLGPLGSFDDSGVYPSSIVRISDVVRLYYIGWMQGKRVPYYASVGLAISRDGGETFEKYSRGPHLARNDVDPFMTLSSCVRQYEDRWHMWYTSATQWEADDDHPRPNYHIKYATSSDGLQWDRGGQVAIDYEHDGEWAIASPTVVKEERTYRMWYSYVVGDQGYRLGYAESEDGIDWERKDQEVGIVVSSDGWDSEQMAYPNVFEHKDERYLLYNGNDYGANGFGIAVER